MKTYAYKQYYNLSCKLMTSSRTQIYLLLNCKHSALLIAVQHPHKMQSYILCKRPNVSPQDLIFASICFMCSIKSNTDLPYPVLELLQDKTTENLILNKRQYNSSTQNISKVKRKQRSFFSGCKIPAGKLSKGFNRTAKIFVLQSEGVSMQIYFQGRKQVCKF